MAAALVLATRAAVILANALAYADVRAERDQLHRALETRGVIDQAKGVIINRDGVDAEQAFTQLSASSRTSNCKLHQVAAEVVHAAQRESAGSAR